MRLTTFSDYTLRVLMYLALHPNRFVTIPEIAVSFGVSTNHLMKVVQQLAATGDVVTLRGPHGGLRRVRTRYGADPVRGVHHSAGVWSDRRAGSSNRGFHGRSGHLYGGGFG
jgi:hypothetical protein